MTEVLDVRAIQSGSWWLVSVPGLPGLMAQVSNLQPRQLSSALAATGAVGDVVDISVRRVERVTPARGPAGADRSGGERRQGRPTWTEQAVTATRLAPARVPAGSP
jgi:hypothetical protein